MTPKKPIKEVKAPKLEIEEQELHDAIKIQLEVIKAEDKKETENQRQATILLAVRSNNYKSEKWELVDMLDKWFYETRFCSGYVDNLKQELKNVKLQYTKRLIRSIISSLWLWATAMFLILNHL